MYIYIYVKPVSIVYPYILSGWRETGRLFIERDWKFLNLRKEDQVVSPTTLKAGGSVYGL